jgi:1,4-dihydroxy-2-naphthoate octaprenyltransferase
MHASVNAFNNYFDYRSKIDERTTKTPFSGGVDILVKGRMKASMALGVSAATFSAAAVIGLYFLSRTFYPLLPLVVYGGLVIVLYTPILSKIHGLSELIAGSGFGLMGLGVYVTQAGVIDAPGITVFVPVTILVALLLFLNEFPDAEVDKVAGRRHIVILLGRRGASWVYVAGLAATYCSIILAVGLKAGPPTILLSLFTVPIAYRAGGIVLINYDNIPKLLPSLGLNVMTILSTILLMAVGFLTAAFVHL